MLVVQHLLGEAVQTPYVFESNSLKKNHLCNLSQVIYISGFLLLSYRPSCSLGKPNRLGGRWGTFSGEGRLSWFAESKRWVPRLMRVRLSREL